MKVTFVHHSSFVVELENTILIFDYFDKSRVTECNFKGVLPKLNPEKRIYFFASHKHRDHFDMDILKFADIYPNVKFIISKDAKMSPNFLKKHGFDPGRFKELITYVTIKSDYHIDDIFIHTLKSTDEGVAFYVEAEGKTIYHAGDLHWWQWEGAGDLINGNVVKTYKRQLQYLQGKVINLSFVVLDPRLKENEMRGLDYFMKEVQADFIFPMHMWQDFDIIRRFKSRSENKTFTDRVMDITDENQVFEIDNGVVNSYVEMVPEGDIKISIGS